MAISFLEIPTGQRTPGVFTEVDNSKALGGLLALNQKCIMIGQKFSTGSATSEVAIQVANGTAADAYFGKGSHLANMVKIFKRNNEFTELWCVPVADSGTTYAAGSITVAGPATANGTCHLYVDGVHIQVPVDSGDTATAIATDIVALVQANLALPLSATLSSTPSSAVLTARNAGTLGNNIDVRANYNLGEALPAGITLTVVEPAAGATDPDITNALAAIPDEHYDYLVQPYTDATNLLALEAELNRRWGHSIQQEMIAFTACNDSAGDLTTLGNTRNNKLNSIMGYENSPSAPWSWAAAYGAVAARYLNIDPAAPLQTIVMEGILPPALTDRFVRAERNVLLTDGISTFTVSTGGNVMVERAITSYQTNAASLPDASYLDVCTLATLAYIRKQVRIRISNKYPRHKLADDTANIAPGQKTVRPKDIRIELIALFGEMEVAGLVENISGQFSEELIVERNATDPNRVDALLPPDLINQLRIFAAQVQFRLDV